MAAVLLVLLTLGAYHNSFSGPFIFDDVTAIVENPAIRNPSIAALVGPGSGGGLTTSGRSVVALSLVLNHALSGPAVRSYHAVNLLIHICAGLGLFGVVRRTLLMPRLADQWKRVALPLAFTIAALWSLHPLQTESVTYIVQRAESLAGLFYFLTLYAFIRSTDSRFPVRWWVAAVGACLLGMGSKEVVVSAPLMILLYDRIFVSATFRRAWQRHRGLYLMLGATWLGLGGLLVATGTRGGTAGFNTDVSAWSYAVTQCRAIVLYIALAIWPARLVFDYGLAMDHHLADVWPQALAVGALVVGIVVTLRRSPPAGFVGLWFLALLAPSSSFIPIVTQTMAEHRMYLPMAAVLVGAVLGLYRAAGSRAMVAAGVAAVALGIATAGRNQVYRSDEAIWRDTVRKLPTNARAHNNLGQAVFRTGKITESIQCYERALQLQPNYAESHYNLGVSLARVDRLPEAVERYQRALELQPIFPEADNNLGAALVRAGRGSEAIPHYERAVAAKPDFPEAYSNLGSALLQAGRVAEAELSLKQALELRPAYAEARYHLGNVNAARGAMAEALAQYQQALQLRPDYPEAHVNAGNALLALAKPREAIAHYEQAVTLAPELADAQFNLGSALLELGRWADAIPRLESALRLNPTFVRAHRALAFALVELGRVPDAIPHYERYLAAAPADAEAREELRQLQRRLPKP